MSEFITPNELAEEMGVSPKSLRRWMRKHMADTPGRGNRWAITPELADFINSDKGYFAPANHKVTVAQLKD